MTRAASLLVILSLLLAACGADADHGLVVSDARIGQPTGPNAALYFTAMGGDADDRLVGAETESAASVEMHETMSSGDGTTGMRAIEALELPARETLVLEPGGLHLMLVEARRMEVGDTVEIVLRWEDAGEMSIEAEVVSPSDTVSDDS